MVVVLPEDVEADLSVVGGVDAAIPEEQLLVVRKGEGFVRGIVRAVTSGIVLFEVRVPGCLANLAQDTFLVHDQYSVEMFRGNNHTMVESITLGFKSLFGVDVGSPGQGVRFCSESSRAVVDGEVVFGENFGPTGLATAELFSCGKVLEVVVVRVDLNTVPGSLEVGTPLLESFDNGKEFLIVDVVVEFGVNHRPGVEGDGA
ncbi:hypothetical protein C0992_000795 [Termitomyces sp. T32_za158]|nr:hypothetical protein C0992_000795 [Termitomyces sp. T32_za158]